MEAELRAAAERHEAHEAELRQQLEAARQLLARQEAEVAGGRAGGGGGGQGRLRSSPHVAKLRHLCHGLLRCNRNVLPTGLVDRRSPDMFQPCFGCSLSCRWCTTPSAAHAQPYPASPLPPPGLNEALELKDVEVQNLQVGWAGVRMRFSWAKALTHGAATRIVQLLQLQSGCLLLVCAQ